MIVPSRIALLALAIPGMALAADIPPADDQIHAAVSPAPEVQRADATVLGYDAEGGLIELRSGDGDLVCLADDPTDERFHVACYHHSLEPFMARGRALRAEGLERAEVVRIRGEEIAAGKLTFPSSPAALYSLSGGPGSFDAETQTVRDGTRIHTIYVAYATAEETGLPTEPVQDGAPWLMTPGEPWAHIMVIQPVAPPADEAE